jgi:predicted ArsR family transcriptional regulator
VFHTLAARGEPATLAALAAATDLHVNTLREHLDALEQHGYLQRRRAEPSGRGRPAWLYDAVEPPDRSEYAGLAVALAAAIHRSSATPREDAIAAGREWGHELARSPGPVRSRELAPEPRPTPERDAAIGEIAARRRVVTLLGDLGFAPETEQENTTVRLTRCPLLDAAHRYPDIVCGVHLGIVRGVLDELGADPSRTALAPFAEPGACRLDLT